MSLNWQPIVQNLDKTTKHMNYANALIYATSVNARLPTITELKAEVEINPQGFLNLDIIDNDNVKEIFWSTDQSAITGCNFVLDSFNKDVSEYYLVSLLAVRVILL